MAKKKRALRAVAKKRDDAFVSIKLPTEFVAWLRVEAEKRGKFMYRLVLDHVAAGVRGRPWDQAK